MTRLRLFALLTHALLAAALLGVTPGAALADDPEPEVSDQVDGEPAVDPLHHNWDRLLGVALTGGADTPFGVIGGQVIVQPLRWLRLDLGGGVSRDGGRFAGGVSVVLPQDHFALILRVGAAGGPLSWDAGRETQIHRYWSFAAFLDSSLGLEYHFDEGVLIQLYAGVETTLNDSADACAMISSTPETTCSSSAIHDHPARLFVGLTVGYMFDIYP